MVSGSTGNSPQSPNFGLFWALVPDKMGETARIGGGDLRGGVKKNSKNRKFYIPIWKSHRRWESQIFSCKPQVTDSGSQ